MAKQKKSGYNTNLASEFHVISVLHRLGLDANLTLGNKKAVMALDKFENAWHLVAGLGAPAKTVTAKQRAV